jgi:hypothetical protein
MALDVSKIFIISSNVAGFFIELCLAGTKLKKGLMGWVDKFS